MMVHTIAPDKKPVRFRHTARNIRISVLVASCLLLSRSAFAEVKGYSIRLNLEG